jgi:hypothetical protein
MATNSLASEKRLTGAGIEPGEASTHRFDIEFPGMEVFDIDACDLRAGRSLAAADRRELGSAG